MAGECIHLRLDLTMRPAMLGCEPEQADGVVLELVANARRAIAQDGRIDVRARQVGNMVWLLVADTGAGMTRRQLESVLARMRSNRRGEHGSGHRQVHALSAGLGGQLLIRSRRHYGAVVALVVPALVPATTGNCE
jgi:signal transduction histidine kinase